MLKLPELLLPTSRMWLPGMRLNKLGRFGVCPDCCPGTCNYCIGDESQTQFAIYVTGTTAGTACDDAECAALWNEQTFITSHYTACGSPYEPCHRRYYSDTPGMCRISRRVIVSWGYVSDHWTLFLTFRSGALTCTSIGYLGALYRYPLDSKPRCRATDVIEYTLSLLTI